MTMTKPTDIRPPFTAEMAAAKVRAAENAWNTRDPERVSMAYSEDSLWRNRDQFLTGRDEIQAFLKSKWEEERDYRLCKALWAFEEDKIAVRFQYEYRGANDQWFRAYGNELWAFDREGLMCRREASINDMPIDEAGRKFLWPAGSHRPDNHPGIPELA